jgi:hypothetical protein
MKPYLGLVHSGERIIVDLRAIMASNESEAYLRFAQFIPATDINLADVKIVVWQAGTTNPVTFGHDHTENFEYWTQTITN